MMMTYDDYVKPENLNTLAQTIVLPWSFAPNPNNARLSVKSSFEEIPHLRSSEKRGLHLSHRAGGSGIQNNSSW